MKKTFKKVAMLVCLVIVAFLGVLQMNKPASACYLFCDVACMRSGMCNTLGGTCDDRTCQPGFPCNATTCANWCAGCYVPP
jgi:hypothetical protein